MALTVDSTAPKKEPVIARLTLAELEALARAREKILDATFDAATCTWNID